MSWQDAPLVSPPAAAPAPAWASAPVVSPPAAASPAGGGVLDKIIGGVQAGLRVAADTIDSLGGYAGTVGGTLGGLAGALHTQLTGGVQPDDPRVLAVTGDNRPRTWASGEAPQPITALDEAGREGAQTAVNALHSGPSMQLNNEMGQRYAGAIESGLQTLAQAYPTGPTPEMNAGLQSIGPAVTMARASRAGQAVESAVSKAGANLKAVPADMVQSVKQNVGGGVARVMGKPDPELVKVAQLADQFPHEMTIPPDRLYQPGTAKSAGQALSEATAGGGHTLEAANKQAFTKNVINLIDPDSTAARLTPEVLHDAMDKSGGVIGDIARSTDLPATDLASALESHARDAARTGAGDVPRIVPNLIEDLLEKAGPDGTIPGDAFQNWDSNLGTRIRRTTDSELAGALSDLQEAGRDILEKQVAAKDPTQVQALADARRQYAYAKIVAPDVSKTIDGLVQPGSLMSRVTATRSGKGYMAANAGGPIGDLAKVGKLLDNTAKPEGVAVTGMEKMLTAVPKAVAGQVYNRVAGETTARLVPKRTAPPAAALAAPAAPAKPLMITYDPRLSADAIPVTPEGQALPGNLPQAREDLQTSQRAAGGTGAPPRATTFADYDLSAPEFQAPVPPAAAATPVSDLRAVPQESFPVRAGAAAREVPEPSFPHDIVEPDMAPVMVSGRPGETAATVAGNAAMNEPGAVAARAAQAKAAEDAAAAAKAAEEAKTAAAEKAKAAAAEKAKAEALPSIQYEDAVEWRKAHGVGNDAEAHRAILTRQAHDIDPETIEAAAVQHNHNPRAFDKVVDRVLAKGKQNADEIKPAAQGSQGAAAKPAESGGAAGAAGEPAGADGTAAPGTNGHAPAAGGQATQAVDEATRKAEFEAAHPRADDGTFVEKPPLTVAKTENRKNNPFRKAEDGPEYAHTRVTLSDGSVYHLSRLDSTASMGVPGWHLDEDVGAKTPGTSYLADTREGAVQALLAKLNARKKVKE